jgi:Flp pilus assembly protein TadG
MVEFALVATFLFFILLALVEFALVTNGNTSVHESARQAARQAAANAAAAPDPWAARDANPCSGTQLAPNAGGAGCLTDAAMLETVKAVMKNAVCATCFTLYTGTLGLAQNCPNPTVGSVNVCISPNEGPASASGTRHNEWSTNASQGSYQVQVTVIYAYRPITGPLSGLLGGLKLRSTSSTVAEY